MKRFLVTLLLILGFLIFTNTVSADTNTVKSYDSKGAYQGKIVKSGNTKKHYDKHGNYIGKSVVRGNTEKYYDKHGMYLKKEIDK